jgi:hypothetical protein
MGTLFAVETAPTEKSCIDSCRKHAAMTAYLLPPRQLRLHGLNLSPILHDEKY